MLDLAIDDLLYLPVVVIETDVTQGPEVGERAGLCEAALRLALQDISDASQVVGRIPWWFSRTGVYLDLEFDPGLSEALEGDARDLGVRRLEESPYPLFVPPTLGKEGLRLALRRWPSFDADLDLPHAVDDRMHILPGEMPRS